MPFDFTKFQKLPSIVQEAMLSEKNAEINLQIKNKYNLSEEQFSGMLDVIVSVWFKEIPLKNFISSLKEKLKVQKDLVEKISLEVLQKRFWPLRDYLGNVELLIRNMGGEIPNEAENISIPKGVGDEAADESVIESHPSLEKGIREDIKSAIKKYGSEIDKLFITKSSLYSKTLFKKISPSLDNWLKDYLAEKGAKYHSVIERTDYLFGKGNPQNLSGEERNKLALVLKSYDETIPLILSKKDNFLEVFSKEEFLSTKEKEEPITKRLPSFQPIDLKIEGKEIAEIKERMSQSPLSPQENLAEKAKEILEKIGQKFSDKVLEQRFKNIILFYLKGLRDDLEVRAILLREKERGGMNMEEKLVDNIIKIIREASKKTIEKPFPPLKLLEEPEEIKKAEAIPYYQERTGISPEKTLREKEDNIPLPLSPTTPTPPQAGGEGEKVGFKVPPLVEKKSLSLEKEIKFPEQPKPIQRPAVETIKTKVTDITKSPKVIGPIEELRMLNLENFYRLASNIEEIINKIKQKIDLLGEESIERKIKAIQAWHENQISRLYLQIGRESIEQGKPIKEIVAQRKIQQRPTLAEEEFYAIGDLNRSLRF